MVREVKLSNKFSNSVASSRITATWKPPCKSVIDENLKIDILWRSLFCKYGK